MAAEPEQYAIADLLANAIEPWDGLTAPDAFETDDHAAAAVVIAAYRNERGAVLIDGVQRLRHLAEPPHNRKYISAEEVIVEPAAVDEESANLAAVKLAVSRRPASARAKAELALRLRSRFGSSRATIAEALQVSGPVVSNWIKQRGDDIRQLGGDVVEVTGADGKVYPARGKQAAPAAAAGTLAEALHALHADHHQAIRQHPPIRHIQVDRRGTTDPKAWKVTIPAQSASAAAEVAALLRDQADDLLSLARKLSKAQDASRKPAWNPSET